MIIQTKKETLDHYYSTFQWNSLKYRTDKSLKEIVESISIDVNQIDQLLKAKLAAYSSIKIQLSVIQRKQTYFSS